MAKVIDVAKDPDTGVYGVQEKPRRKKRKRTKDRKVGERRKARRLRARGRGAVKKKTKPRKRGSKLRRMPTGSVLLMNPSPVEFVKRAFKARKEMSNLQGEMKKNFAVGATVVVIAAIAGVAGTLYFTSDSRRREKGFIETLFPTIGKVLNPLIWSTPLFWGSWWVGKQAKSMAPRSQIWARAAAFTLIGSGIVMFYKKLPGSGIGSASGQTNAGATMPANKKKGSEVDIANFYDEPVMEGSDVNRLQVSIVAENVGAAAKDVSLRGLAKVWSNAAAAAAGEKPDQIRAEPTFTAGKFLGTGWGTMRESISLARGAREILTAAFPDVSRFGEEKYASITIELVDTKDPSKVFSRDEWRGVIY
jgi:hypothetical protein